MSLYAIFGSALAAGSNAAQLLQANPVSNTNQITPVAPAPIPPAPAAATGNDQAVPRPNVGSGQQEAD